MKRMQLQTLCVYQYSAGSVFIYVIVGLLATDSPWEKKDNNNVHIRPAALQQLFLTVGDESMQEPKKHTTTSY